MKLSIRPSALLAVALCVLLPESAAADGPYEPNETAAMVTAPLTASRIDAGLETPQDVDWYLLYPQGVRQVGLLISLNTPCTPSYGNVYAKIIDAEGSPYVPVALMSLGRDPSNPNAPKTVDTASFTSQVGHRYFIRVSQSSCPGASYSIAIAPTGVLGTKLAPTAECTASRKAATNARVKLHRFQTARRRAHGARRRELTAKIQLQQQQVTQAAAAAAATCTRQAVTGSGWT